MRVGATLEQRYLDIMNAPNRLKAFVDFYRDAYTEGYTDAGEDASADCNEGRELKEEDWDE